MNIAIFMDYGKIDNKNKVKIKLAKPGGNTMKKYECKVCGYIYDPVDGDPDNGVAPGTAFEDLPEDWVCPLCSAEKDEFEAI